MSQGGEKRPKALAAKEKGHKKRVYRGDRRTEQN
jgi:hypothetical protein